MACRPLIGAPRENTTGGEEREELERKIYVHSTLGEIVRFKNKIKWNKREVYVAVYGGCGRVAAACNAFYLVLPFGKSTDERTTSFHSLSLSRCSLIFTAFYKYKIHPSPDSISTRHHQHAREGREKRIQNSSGVWRQMEERKRATLYRVLSAVSFASIWHVKCTALSTQTCKHLEFLSSHSLPPRSNWDGMEMILLLLYFFLRYLEKHIYVVTRMIRCLCMSNLAITQPKLS